MIARKATFSVLTIALLLGLTTNLGGCDIGGSEGGEGEDIEQQAPEGDDEGEEGEDDD